MSTIHIHPTVACDVSRIFALQRATGLLAVIRGDRAELVTRTSEFRPRISAPAASTTGNGPEAA